VLTVCATCQQRLMQRQSLQDHLMVEQTEFDREMARHRLFHQMQALNLQAERTRLMAESQAARLGKSGKPALLWVFDGVRWTLGKVIEHAQRALR
jgi:hypothetical protein